MVVVSSSFAVPAEGVLLQAPTTKLLVNDHEVGTATLYITEQNVVWGGGVSPQGGPAPSLTLLYPTISLHAIQREPSPALYMVLNFELSSSVPEIAALLPSMEGEEDDDEDFDAYTPMTQLRFVPHNENELDGMYSAMSQGQALHPDPNDEPDEEPYMDGEDFFEEDEFEDAEESTQATDEAAARLRQMRLENHNGDAHYDDDDDVEAADVD